MSPLASKSNAQHINAGNYTFTTEKYIEVSFEVTSRIASVGTVANLYMRTVNVRNSSSADGKIEIDYIYLGPESNADNIRPTTEKNVLINFGNSAYDKNRYSGEVYGSVNYDVAAGWNNTHWFSYGLNHYNGILTLTPTSNFADWGQIEANTVGRDAMMNYKMTGNDYAVVRMKLNTSAAKGSSPNIQFQFGGGAKSALTGEYANIEAYIVTNSIDVRKNGQWGTYVFNLYSYAKKMPKMTFFRLVWSQVGFNSGGNAQIDYIYVGRLSDSYAPADSLYIGFNNRQEDKLRYSDRTYGGIDDPVLNPYVYDTATMTGHELDNLNGNMVYNMMTDIGEEYPDAHIDLNTAAHGMYPLNFTPKDADVFQIRFKLENTHAKDEPYVSLHTWGKVGTETVEVSTPAYNFAKNDHENMNGQYYTVTVPLDGLLDDYTKITRVRPYFGQIASEDGYSGRVYIDYFYIGPGDKTPSDQMTYGFDSTYYDDPFYSNSSSYFIEGMGIPKFNSDYSINHNTTTAYSESTFTFTGTGFDIISSTGDRQGMIRAVIFDAAGKYVKAVQVLNKSESSLDLYQVPVISVEKLTYGTYTVKIYVASAYDYGNDGIADAFVGSLDRGGEFYFDVVRIYNPINTASNTTDSEIAYKAYQYHSKADPEYTEIRSILLEEKSFTAGGEMEGIAYLDNTQKEPTLANYESYGSNNEVYLSTGNAIAFKMAVDGTIPASIDLSAKSANGNAANLTIQISSSAPGTKPAKQDLIVETTLHSIIPWKYLQIHGRLTPMAASTSMSLSTTLMVQAFCL